MKLPNSETFAGTFWIVRSADERTTAACLHLIREFIPPERTAVVRERPFARALAVTYELALEKGFEWTVVIDADVYVHRPGWAELVAEARLQPDDVFYVQGLTVDKFIPIIRSAGSGMYRTSSLPLALRSLQRAEGALRPETEAVQSILRRGYRMWRTPIVAGMHDFDQAYVDVVRKAYLHVHKHANVLDGMLAYWESSQAADDDFKAALLGHALSIRHRKQPLADRDFMRAEYAEAILGSGLGEKPPLKANTVSPSDIKNYLAGFQTDIDLQAAKFPEYERHYYVPVRGGKWTKRWVSVKNWWLRGGYSSK